MALDELRAHLATLDPLLQRLATDDVAWEVSLPAEAVHVSASASDVERCLTALVTSARDALPLGGRLALSVHTPGARQTPDHSAVRRLDAHLVLEAQGYGLTTFEVPQTLRDLAAASAASLTSNASTTSPSASRCTSLGHSSYRTRPDRAHRRRRIGRWMADPRVA